MRASPSRRAVAAAQTLAVALAVSALVVGAAYGVQRVLLRAPSGGELVAARIEGSLLRYHYVTAEIHVPGEPARRAECLEGWEPKREGRPAGRGARVVFSDGERLLLGDRRVIRLRGAEQPTHLPPIAEVELAGCGRSITNHIYGRLVGPHRIAATPTTFHGRAALTLHVRTKRTRFDLYVHAHTLEPLGLQVQSRGIVAWSIVEPVKLNPARKRAFLRRFDG